MPLSYCQLSLEERRRIFRLVDVRTPVAEIAAALGRHPSTIYREIRRNRVGVEPDLRRYRFYEHAYFEGYYPLAAQDLAHERRRRLGKLQRDERLRGYVIDKLAAFWSPEQIAGRLKLDGLLRCVHADGCRHVLVPPARQQPAAARPRSRRTVIVQEREPEAVDRDLLWLLRTGSRPP
jgi:IS30 family transposase